MKIEKKININQNHPESCGPQLLRSFRFPNKIKSILRSRCSESQPYINKRLRYPIKTLGYGTGYFKKAFTLIELLVVVLIIGILAAIAVPQYQVAVGKTRAMNLYTLLKSFQKAEQVYYLTNGKYTQNADELDISYPAGSTRNVAIVTCKNGTRIYFLDTLVFAATDKVQLQVMYKHSEGTCWATDDKISQQICASMGKKTNTSSTCSALGGKTCYMYRLTF